MTQELSPDRGLMTSPPRSGHVSLTDPPSPDLQPCPSEQRSASTRDEPDFIPAFIDGFFCLQTLESFSTFLSSVPNRYIILLKLELLQIRTRPSDIVRVVEGC